MGACLAESVRRHHRVLRPRCGFRSDQLNPAGDEHLLSRGIELFKRGRLLERGEIRGTLLGTRTGVNGFYSYLETQRDVEIVPGIAARAVTCGKVTAEAFDQLVRRLEELIKEAGRLDGILRALHGAMVSEEIEDCEGYLL